MTSDLLASLSEDEHEVLKRYMIAVEFPPEATICSAGDPGDCAYLIDEGEVRVEIDHPELDSDTALCFLGPGDILGEIGLLDRMPRSANAIAHTHVRARRLEAVDLDDLAIDEPAIALSIFRSLAKEAASKLRATTQQLSEFMFEQVRDPAVDEMVERAKAAQAEFASFSEERVDALLAALREAFMANSEVLAQEAVAETHVGNVADKLIKNKLGADGVYQSLVGQIGQGEMSTDALRKVTEIASPVGVIFCLVPMTNPIATAFFKTLIGLKGRNAVILSFHRAALNTGNHIGELIQKVLVEQNVPQGVVQWVKSRVSRKTTNQFMTHPDVSLIIATGGSDMVRAAYSSGTPAIGVGPGNAPCWIAADADLDHAAWSIVISKSFDNGLICGSEHNLVVDSTVRERFIEALEKHGAVVLTPQETNRFMEMTLDPTTQKFHPQVLGQSAASIAKLAGITRKQPIKILVLPATWSGEPNPLAGEKMAPMVSLFTVQGDDEAIDFCQRLLRYMGTGHTSMVHSKDDARIARFGAAIPTGRILVNSPGFQGVGGMMTGLAPSFTLGCGTFGGNSTTDNITYRNLINVKRLAHFLPPKEPH